jgi:hypothetical protein
VEDDAVSAMPSIRDAAYLDRLLAEIDHRNVDNVARTESYLELYAYTRAHPPDLPWVLMAHLVSRNGGYLMTDVASSLERGDGVFAQSALEQLFLFLERANFLIFYDAWWHVLHHLTGRAHALLVPRVPRFVVEECWPRYERVAAGGGVTPEVERRLVQDLVTNEQNFIERRVVHNARFEAARAIISFVEALGREAPVVMPCTDQRIRVGGFSRLERRIATGYRIFDDILADAARREEIFHWAREHRHTGSREAYGGRSGPTLRRSWPLSRVRALWAGAHDPPEADPQW